ncbi:MAG TPA: hypothetical protein DD640_06475 [Clostridiales bacterium]|nr:hypothetical protein [Clostridiales bacterium]
MPGKRRQHHVTSIYHQLILQLILVVVLQGLLVLPVILTFSKYGGLARNVVIPLQTALLAALLLGAAIDWLIGQSIVRPIIRLVCQVRQQVPNQTFHLERTAIKELNELAESLEEMSADLASSASRLASTIDLVGLRLASFEEWPDKGSVHVSDSFFSMAGLMPIEPSGNLITLAGWNDFLQELLARPDPAYSDVYIWQPEHSAKKRWLRLRMVDKTNRVSGILMDVTEEVLRHRRLELERDYDALTHLLNKAAFIEQCTLAVSQAPEQAIGVMLFSDLDNLKKINDRYGHKFGDRYIQMAAGVFGQFRRYQGLAARLSGDEFAVFLIGKGDYADQEGMRILVSQILAENRQQFLAVPDEQQIALRMSVGLAWFPSDAAQISELINLADFAMYQIKKEGKAGLHEFQASEYQQNQVLMEGRANLEQLLCQKQLECVAQPVVDARTAEVAGYAMTMRPLHSRIRLPLEVVELARQQNRLDELERLMFLLCSQWIGAHLDPGSAKLIFFSALAGLNRVISDSPDEFELAPFRRRLVVDINSSETRSERSLQQLTDFVACLSGMLAVSQLHSNEQDDLPARIQPDYIRLDHSVIRDIDKDAARQQLLASRVSWCASQGIQVIAEGIETEAEMITAIRLGADFLQGYYLGRPQLETAELATSLRLQILSARGLA